MPGKPGTNFKRCVAAVSARGGAYDPRAVCAAEGRKKYGAAEFARLAGAGRRRALKNPGEIELDSKTAAQQYKRLIEMDGAKDIKISRRGRKHVVKWNPLDPITFLAYGQPILAQAGKRLHLNRRGKKNGLFDFGRKTTTYRVKTGAVEGSAGRHKGYTIYKRADGAFSVPSLDSSVFDTKRDATRFIDSWVKNNPGKVPKKVLEGHRRVWGGKIPAGAMEQLRREYARDAQAKQFRKALRKGHGRVNGRKNGRRVRRNTVEAAREKYEEFHGRPSEELIEVTTPIHVHTVLSGLGELTKLVILSVNKHWRVTLKNFGGTILAQNEDSDKMPQLYLEGGDQEVDLEQFGLTEPVHEFEELGRLEWAYYDTVKDHLGDDGGDAIYRHKLGGKVRGGARGREKPVVIYDVKNKLLQIAGGAYTILPEGIDN